MPATDEELIEDPRFAAEPKAPREKHSEEFYDLELAAMFDRADEHWRHTHDPSFWRSYGLHLLGALAFAVAMYGVFAALRN